MSKKGSLFRSFLVVHVALSVVAALIQTLVLLIYLVTFGQTIEQQLHWNIAADVKRQLSSVLAGPSSSEELSDKLNELSRINPRADFYAVDLEGNILAGGLPISNYTQSTKIRVQPIHTFLSSVRTDEQTIYGDDPSAGDRNKGDTPISAAKIQWKGQDAYLYVVIGGIRHHLASDPYVFRILSWLVVTFFLSGLLASVLLGKFILRRLSRRFEHMTEVTRTFRQGDFSARINDKHPDEIGEHARAFDEMADAMAHSISQLRQEDRVRKDLVANISHDLRTPLAVIQTSLEYQIVNAGRLDQAEYLALTNQAIAQCKVLSRMVDEFFSFARLEGMESLPVTEEVRLDVLAQDVVSAMQVRAAAAQIELVVEAAKNLPAILGDLDMLERLITNLVENALRYTPEKGRVAVTLSSESDDLVLKVSDTGIGIAESEIPLIFERFYRSKSARLRAPSKGTGLGLAIARRIVELHGAKIYIESKVDVGSVFTICFRRPS